MRYQVAVLVSALAIQAASAQDPWTEFLKPSPGSGAPRWRLILDPVAREALFPTPPAFFARMMVAEELQIQAPNPEVVVRLWAAKNFSPEQHWLLISPDGEVLPGPGPNPHPNQVLELLRGRGFVPRWERRAAFLKEHPQQGEARLEALKDSTLVASLQARKHMGKPGPRPAEGPFFPFPETDEGRAKADEISHLYEADLEAFLELPDPERAGWSSLRTIMRNLVAAGWHQAPRMEALRTRLIEKFLRGIDSGTLAALLSLPSALQQAGPQAERAMLAHLPHQTFTPPLMHPALGFLRALRIQSTFLTPSELLDGLQSLDLGGFAASMEDESQYLLNYLREDSLHLQFRCLLQVEKWDAAAIVLARLRPYLYARGTSEHVLEILKSECGDSFLQRPELKAILASPPPPPQPTPVPPPPLRLCLLGSPSWKQEWQALKGRPEFAPWGVKELRWEEMAPPLAQALQAQQGWSSQPRWVLFRKDSILATDSECPSPSRLADRLLSLSPSQLHHLSALLEKFPDHQALHQRRMELLLHVRMPNPLLEPLLAQDMLAAEEFEFPTALTLEGWQPTGRIWEHTAMKALPRIESSLQRWPSRKRLWEAWVFWASLHPRKPSVLDLLDQVPFWERKGDWSAALPLSVNVAVAGAFRAKRRHEEMRAWFQKAWDGLDLRPFTQLTQEQQEDRLEQLPGWEAGIVRPLREALKALGRAGELRSLDRTWAMMQGKEKAK